MTRGTALDSSALSIRQTKCEEIGRNRPPATVDLSDVVDEVLLLSAPLAPEGMRFSVSLAMEMLPVEMEYRLLSHIVFDLMRFVEAHSSKPDGGVWQAVKISTYRQEGAYYCVGIVELSAKNRTKDGAEIEDGAFLSRSELQAVAELVERQGGFVEFRRDTELDSEDVRLMLGLPLCA